MYLVLHNPQNKTQFNAYMFNQNAELVRVNEENFLMKI